MNKTHTTLTAVALSLALSAAAVPAKRGLMVVSQPDGTTISIQKVGDEHMHFTLSDDNKLLIRDNNGQFSYANIDNSGKLKSTGVKALNSAARPKAHAQFLQTIDEVQPAQLKARRTAKSSRQKVAQTGMGTFTSNFPKKGEIRGLILLVEYADVKFNTSYKTSAKQYFNDLIKKEGFDEYGAYGSATDYFKYASNGQFLPEFDVVGPITLSKKRAYYGGNDSYGNDKYPELMVSEACKLADNEINFADYDNDGDGEVDNVYVIYAGVGEASSDEEDAVWPHSWEISSGTGSKVSLDGVLIDRYACSNEWQASNKPDGIGTFVHEFSHVMGLPDLYDTTYKHSATPGSYSIMDYGSYNNDSRTPPVYSSFERNAMGWIEPTVIKEADMIELENLATSNQACIIQTSLENEFYLIENRQQTGWDKFIPNHGMIIWHIDFNQRVWDRNEVNNNKSHQYVDIVEANNNTSNNKGWTWPGTSGNTNFTSTTTPALKMWDGTAIDVPITNIEENNGIISFDVNGGTKLAVPVPHDSNLIEKSNNHFVASWDEVPGATDYKVWVYAVADENADGANAEETETADMGSLTTAIALPNGWECSSDLEHYNSTTNSGKAIPSAKFKLNDSYIQTREYDKDVTEISFWIKGIVTNDNSKMMISGKVDGKWETISTVSPELNKGKTITITEIPDGVKQVKFTHVKGLGNIAIDDITITTGNNAKDELLAQYNGVLTGGKTSLRIDNLKAGCNNYKFAVAATENGKAFTKKSDFSYLSLVTTGVDNITTSENEMTVSVYGNTVTVNTDAAMVEIFDTLGRKVATAYTANNEATFTLKENAIFIVRAGNKTAKIVTK